MIICLLTAQTPLLLLLLHVIDINRCSFGEFMKFLSLWNFNLMLNIPALLIAVLILIIYIGSAWQMYLEWLDSLTLLYLTISTHDAWHIEWSKHQDIGVSRYIFLSLSSLSIFFKVIKYTFVLCYILRHTEILWKIKPNLGVFEEHCLTCDWISLLNSGMYVFKRETNFFQKKNLLVVFYYYCSFVVL